MRDFLMQKQIPYKESVMIGQLTGMNQKGILPLVVYPDSINKLKNLMIEIWKRGISYDILGGLSNTYLCESYYRDIVIITTYVRDYIHQYKSILIGCGYNLTKLSNELSNEGIAGYEGFIGIPGTVGAAAINNSGAFTSSMSKVVLGILLLNEKGDEEFLNKEQLQYNTRNSLLKRNLKRGVVLAVTLDISKKTDTKSLIEKINMFKKIRKEKIDGKRKSLGSIFVSSTLHNLYKHHRIAILLKKILNQPLKLLFHDQRINTYMDFLFLGKPTLAKHCDSLNRFSWDKNTTEKDFFFYLDSMQKLAHNELTLEIEIKK